MYLYQKNSFTIRQTLLLRSSSFSLSQKQVNNHFPRYNIFLNRSIDLIYISYIFFFDAVLGFRLTEAMSLRPNARAEVRRNRYKVAVDAEEGRRRREDNMVEIRKSKREESLLKKRREGLQAQQFPSSVHTTTVEKKVSFISISLCLLSL